MKKYFLILFTFLALVSCTNGQQQTNTKLNAQDYEVKSKSLTNAIIVDVRTPNEFVNGHLQNAINIDWNSDDFQSKIKEIDKEKPVFVYCLSGGRSATAAENMRKNGFKEVYELDGGLIKWKTISLTKTNKNAPSTKGMNKEQFEDLIKSDKLVLVDFYADWCAPCKKMKPFLDEISKEMADKVTIVRINADDNPQLCAQLGVDALPILQLYKNSNLTWVQKGYIGKEELVKRLK